MLPRGKVRIRFWALQGAAMREDCYDRGSKTGNATYAGARFCQMQR